MTTLAVSRRRTSNRPNLLPSPLPILRPNLPQSNPHLLNRNLPRLFRRPGPAMCRFRRCWTNGKSARPLSVTSPAEPALKQIVALNIKLDLSEDMARQRHGEELVDKAKDWVVAKMAQSPTFQQEVLSNRNPYEFAVQAFQRDQVVSQLKPADLDAFRAWQAATAAAQQAQPPAGASPPIPVAAAPPRSLASVASAAGSSSPDTGSAFDAIFEKG